MSNSSSLTPDELLTILYRYCEQNGLVCMSQGQQTMPQQAYTILEVWIPMSTPIPCPTQNSKP